MEAVLNGVVMELMDCAMPLLKREYGWTEGLQRVKDILGLLSTVVQGL